MTGSRSTPQPGALPGTSAAVALQLLVELAAALLNAPFAIAGLRGADGVWTGVGANVLPECLPTLWPELELALESSAVLERTFPPDRSPIDHVRFLAAISFKGNPEGVLAVLDHQPRSLNPHERELLQELCRFVAEALTSSEDQPSPGPDDLVFTLDLGGRIIGVTSTDSRFNRFRTDLVDSSILDIVPPESVPEIRERLLAQLGGASQSFEVSMNIRQGDPVRLTLRTRLIFEEGQPVGIEGRGRSITTAHEIDTLRREAEFHLDVKTRQLERFSHQLRQLQSLSVVQHAGVVELCLLYVQTGCRMFQLPLGTVEDRDGTRIAVSGPLSGTFQVAVSAPVTVAGERWGALSFGTFRNAPPPPPGDEDVIELMAQALGHALHVDEMQQHRAELNRSLERQLRHDPLTGLANRLGLSELLENALSNPLQSEREIGLLFIDLDRFKQINDTLGHSAGDELLRQVGARLKQCCPRCGFVARPGGDEFTLAVVNRPSDDELAQISRDVLAAIRAPFTVNDYELFVTASVGISVSPRDGDDPDTLLQRADVAMYRAKRNGKDDFRFFTSDMAALTMNALELETQLHRAIENHELEIRFQPILNIDNGVDSLEVLLAWDNPKLGRIGPSRFIPIAEESGMIISIGRWVLHQACIQNMSWQAAGYPLLRLAVNVSALQFARTDFVDMVAEVLRETGMPPKCLELELTESLVMRDIEESARRMERLRELGVSISIDDFGTGYSSLSYLRRLPVDSLKIDRSFVAEMASSSTSLPLIQTIVVLAHNMGLSVVAEGVETEEQLALLRAIGCDRVQGHLFGEPLKAPAIRALFDKGLQWATG